MKFIRAFFCLQKIYFKQTLIQIFLFYLMLWAVAEIFITFAPTEDGTLAPAVPPYILWPAVALYVYFLLRTILRTWIVDHYIDQYKDSLIMISAGEMGHSSTNLELQNFDQLTPISNFGRANLFIATFNFYRHTKNGDYLAKQAYYTVLEMPLDRKLPHILFDSRSAKRRQFKSLYLKAQKISVQGTFDQIFDTYVPQTYTIDSLSFISPEVMQALVDAKMYDIEIIDDRLLLYAPLLDEDDLKPLVSKGKEIAKQINDNIDTYRDNRLKGKERATTVTPFARSLLQSPEKAMAAAIITGAITIVIIYWTVNSSSETRIGILFNQISMLIYAIFAANVWRSVKIIRKNNKAIERYRTLYHTNRGKPIKGK
jgi:hypothetical protein